jgi:hypothetical protein
VNGGRGQPPRQPVRYASPVVYDASPPARFSGAQYPLHSDRFYDEQEDYYGDDMDYDDADYAEYH